MEMTMNRMMGQQKLTKLRVPLLKMIKMILMMMMPMRKLRHPASFKGASPALQLKTLAQHMVPPQETLELQ